MQSTYRCLKSLGKVVHHYLLPLVCVAYGIAAFYPELGSWARHYDMMSTNDFSMRLPTALLAVLMFNASFGTSIKDVLSVARTPAPVLFGVFVNLVAPVAFLVLLNAVLVNWLDIPQAPELILGLSLVAAMPIAASSTAWCQNSSGNIGLSLGLVLLSTLISPLSTPLVLGGIQEIQLGSLQNEIAVTTGHTSRFLLIYVVLPSFAGLTMHSVLPYRFVMVALPILKLLNSTVLLFLCYTNATAALPQVMIQPVWGFLVITVTAAFCLCLTAFVSGWALARVLRVNVRDQRALMFGLGMNNNGSGLGSV